MSLTGIKMVLLLHWGNHIQAICTLDYSVIKDRKSKIQLPFLRNTYLLLGIFEVYSCYLYFHTGNGSKVIYKELMNFFIIQYFLLKTLYLLDIYVFLFV